MPRKSDHGAADALLAVIAQAVVVQVVIDRTRKSGGGQLAKRIARSRLTAAHENAGDHIIPERSSESAERFFPSSRFAGCTSVRVYPAASLGQKQ